MAAPVPDGAAAAADNDIPMDDTDDTWGVTEIGPNDYKAAYSDAYGITGATVYHDVDTSMIMSYGDSTEAEQTNTTLALGDIGTRHCMAQSIHTLMPATHSPHKLHCLCVQTMPS